MGAGRGAIRSMPSSKARAWSGRITSYRRRTPVGSPRCSGTSSISGSRARRRRSRQQRRKTCHCKGRRQIRQPGHLRRERHPPVCRTARRQRTSHPPACRSMPHRRTSHPPACRSKPHRRTFHPPARRSKPHRHMFHPPACRVKPHRRTSHPPARRSKPHRHMFYLPGRRKEGRGSGRRPTIRSRSTFAILPCARPRSCTTGCSPSSMPTRTSSRPTSSC